MEIQRLLSLKYQFNDVAKTYTKYEFMYRNQRFPTEYVFAVIDKLQSKKCLVKSG